MNFCCDCEWSMEHGFSYYCRRVSWGYTDNHSVVYNHTPACPHFIQKPKDSIEIKPKEQLQIHVLSVIERSYKYSDATSEQKSYGVLYRQDVDIEESISIGCWSKISPTAILAMTWPQRGESKKLCLTPNVDYTHGVRIEGSYMLSALSSEYITVFLVTSSAITQMARQTYYEVAKIELQALQNALKLNGIRHYI